MIVFLYRAKEPALFVLLNPGPLHVSVQIRFPDADSAAGRFDSHPRRRPDADLGAVVEDLRVSACDGVSKLDDGIACATLRR